jgi:hypothetical protein
MNKQKNLHLKKRIEKANKRLFNLLNFQPDLQIHRFLYHSTYKPLMKFIVFETFNCRHRCQNSDSLFRKFFLY